MMMNDSWAANKQVFAMNSADGKKKMLSTKKRFYVDFHKKKML